MDRIYRDGNFRWILEREAVAPYLLERPLLRLAVLVKAPCIWDIHLSVPIRTFVVGGSSRSAEQSRFRYPPGYVGSLLVVLRVVVAPNFSGATPSLSRPGSGQI